MSTQNISPTIIIVGSNSVHTTRYINGIYTYCNKIVFITNSTLNLDLPPAIEIFCLNFKLRQLTTKYKLAKILQLHPGAILHIHQANSYAYHAIKAAKIAKTIKQTILTTWGSDILVLPQKSLFLKKMVQFNLANSDIITSDSLYMANIIRQLIPSIKRLEIINFGIKSLPDLGDTANKENIILSSRLHKNLYNIDLIIKAFAKLNHEHKISNYRLVIAGDGEETANLKKLAVQLNITQQIDFVGMVHQSTIAKLYSQAKIFVSVPNSDATSSSLLEAMANGCYPILSNTPANLEWVIDDINGKICQNLNNLDLLLKSVIDNLESAKDSSSWYSDLTKFNYNLITKKALFTNNIKKFKQLYQA